MFALVVFNLVPGFALVLVLGFAFVLVLGFAFVLVLGFAFVLVPAKIKPAIIINLFPITFGAALNMRCSIVRYLVRNYGGSNCARGRGPANPGLVKRSDTNHARALE